MHLLRLIKEQPSWGEGLRCINAVYYFFTTTFSCNSKLVWGKVCCKSFME